MTLKIDPYGQVFLDEHKIEHVTYVSVRNIRGYHSISVEIQVDVDAVEIGLNPYQPPEM